MDAMTSPLARRVRALALVVMLVFAATAVAASRAEEGSIHHPRIHAVKLINANASDQQQHLPRLDQPVAVSQSSPAAAGHAAVGHAAVEPVAPARAAQDSARTTRGPPWAAD